MAETSKSATILEIGSEGSAFQIPVSLKKIRTASDVALDTASPSGNPMKTVNVDLVTGEIVDRDAIQKGVFKVKAKKTDKETWEGFAPISADDLSTIEAATQIESIVIEHFIPLSSVPMERVTDAYFLAPVNKIQSKPLVLLARALKRKKVAGVFKMVKTSRQHLAVVYEKNGGLLVNTIAFANDFAAVREAAEALATDSVKISKAEQDMAERLVGVLTSDSPDAVLDSYEDDLIPLRADLVERALQGKELPKRRKRKASAPVAMDGLEARLRVAISDLDASPPEKVAAAA